MAALVLGVAGAALLGPVGLGLTTASTGWLIGSTVGSLLGGTKGQNVEGPRLNDLTIQASTYGQMVPVIYGAYKVNGNVIACTDLREVRTDTEIGKGGPSATQTTYSYNVDIAIAICDNQISAIRKIFSSGKLTYDASNGADIGTILASSIRATSVKIYLGTETQLPDPTLEAFLGAGNVPAYRGTAYIVFSQLDCPNGQIPQLSFEVLTSSTSTVSKLPLYRAAALVDPARPRLRGHVAKSGGVDYRFPTAFSGTTPRSLTFREFASDYALNLRSTPIAATIYGASQPIIVQGTKSTLVEIYYANLADSGPVGNVMTFRFFDVLEGDEKAAWRVSGINGTYNGFTWAAFDAENNRYAVSTAINGIILDGGVIAKPSSGQAGPCVFWNGVLYMVSSNGANLYARDDNSGTWDAPISIPVGSSTTVMLSSNVTGLYVLAIDRNNNAGGVWRYDGSTVTLICSSLSILKDNLSLSDPDNWESFYADGDCVVVGPNYVNATDIQYTLISLKGLTANPITLASVIADISTRAGVPSGQIDTGLLSDTLDGYALTNVSSARANIEPLLKTFAIDVVKTDGKVKFRPRSTLTSVSTITFDDLGAVDAGSDSGEALALQRTQEDDLPRSLAVSYINQTADYQVGTEIAKRIVTTSVNDQTMQLPVVMSSDKAASVANALLFDAWAERNRRNLKVTRKFAALDAGDVVTVEYPAGRFSPVRITRASDTGTTIDMDVVDFDGNIYTVQALGSPAVGQDGINLIGPTRVEVLDMPILRDVDDNPGVYVALSALTDNWPGGVLYTGPTESTLADSGSAYTSCVLGYADTALGSWADGTMDESNTVTVTVLYGDLYNSTRDEVLTDYANAALLGDEVIQFTTAELLSGKQYRLSGLRRGLRGTELARSTHSIGDRFVLLIQGGMLRPNYDLAELGSTRLFKGVSIGQRINTASTQPAVNAGIGLKPFNAVNIRKIDQSNGDIRFTWDRRTRYADNFLQGVVPLGESVESWEIEIYAGAALKRSFTSSTSYIDYTAQDRYNDNGSDEIDVTVNVYQISSKVGRGYLSTGEFTLPYVAPSIFISSLPLRYAVCKAGSTFIATETTATGGPVSHRLLQSTNNGVTLVKDSRESVFLSKMAVGRADGVYVSLPFCEVPNSDFKNFEAFSMPGVISIMRGVAGSLPRLAATSLPIGNEPISIGYNGSNFIILMEGNHIWTSSDGDTWVDSGLLSGFPYVLSSSYDGNSKNQNYRAGNLFWTGSAWLLPLNSGLYRTTDASAMSGWAAISWASESGEFPPERLAMAGTSIIARPSTSAIERSTDDGVTWSVVWSRSGSGFPTYLSLTEPIAVDGEFYAYTDNGQYRIVGSTSSGASWTITGDSPANGIAGSAPKVSDGSNVLGYSNRVGFGFIYSGNGITYASTTVI